MDIGKEDEDFRIVKETESVPERAPVELPDPAESPLTPTEVPAGK